MYVLEEKMTFFFDQTWNSVFGSKDNVVVNLKVGAHGRFALIPIRKIWDGLMVD